MILDTSKELLETLLNIQSIRDISICKGDANGRI